jgi:hypothetical protein
MTKCSKLGHVSIQLQLVKLTTTSSLYNIANWPPWITQMMTHVTKRLYVLMTRGNTRCYTLMTCGHYRCHHVMTHGKFRCNLFMTRVHVKCNKLMTCGTLKWTKVMMEDNARYCHVATQDVMCLQHAAQILPLWPTWPMVELIIGDIN